MQFGIQTAKTNLPADKEKFFMKVGDKPYTDRKEAGTALLEMCKEMETVERQLETAKVEATKPFAQEAELAEKLERLSVLNALFNMDEKGDDALGMDDVPEEENGGQETSGHDYIVGNGELRVAASMADKPMQRASLKEKEETL